jgi:Phosphotransferase enzyme family
MRSAISPGSIVLGKLRHLKAHTAQELEEAKLTLDISSLARTLGIPEDAIERLGGGTLGSTCLATTATQTWFVKTCVSETGRSDVKREFVLLHHLYGGRLGARLIETLVGTSGRLWLAMKPLMPVDLTPDLPAIRALIAEYAGLLANAEASIEFVGAYDFSDLVDAGEESLASLVAAQLVSLRVSQPVAGALARLQRQVPHLRRVVCHGDLGPANIMRDSQGFVVVDWEDAFSGIEGYDELYWLTFMKNRHLITRDVLAGSVLGPTIAHDVLLLIVVVKSAIAVAQNSYLGDKLSFDERLMEVLAIGS